jgi:hypothetical protein
MCSTRRRSIAALGSTDTHTDALDDHRSCPTTPFKRAAPEPIISQMGGGAFAWTGLLVGAGYGYAAQRGAFCMNSGFRDAVTKGNTTKVKAYVLATTLQMVLVPIVFAVGFSSATYPAFFPVGAVIGGLLSRPADCALFELGRLVRSRDSGRCVLGGPPRWPGARIEGKSNGRREALFRRLWAGRRLIARSRVHGWSRSHRGSASGSRKPRGRPRDFRRKRRHVALGGARCRTLGCAGLA